MATREFLQDLEQTRALFRWEYLEDNRIRGFLRNDRQSRGFDPMAAVAFVKMGAIEAIANRLGLSPADCDAIRSAADDVLWKHVDGELVLDGYCEWLRSGIALATGLEPREYEAPRNQPAWAALAGGSMRTSDLEPQRR